MKQYLSVITLSLALAAGGEARASLAVDSATITHQYGSASVYSPTNSGAGGFGADSVIIVKPDSSSFSDTFTLDAFSLVTSATISVSHNGNFGFVAPSGYGELWRAMVNGVEVGQLTNSFYNWATGTLISGWVTDSFTLDAAALTAINASPTRQAVITFSDGTPGGNNFNLAGVTIDAQGEPVPTPLPAALALFAPGLLGVAAVRRRHN